MSTSFMPNAWRIKCKWSVRGGSSYLLHFHKKKRSNSPNLEAIHKNQNEKEIGNQWRFIFCTACQFFVSTSAVLQALDERGYIPWHDFTTRDDKSLSHLRKRELVKLFYFVSTASSLTLYYQRKILFNAICKLHINLIDV